MKVEKGTAGYAVCPDCGTKYYMLSADGIGNYICRKCGHIFGNNHDGLPDDVWIDEIVDAVRCPNCNRLINCTDENITWGFRKKTVVCPACTENSRMGITFPVVAIRYRNGWHSPQYFLSGGVKDGLKAVRSEKEWIALYVMNFEAKKEEPSFRSPYDKNALYKIFWNSGEAIGYYTYYKFNHYFKAPMLSQIYIVTKQRRQGYATLIWEDFTRMFSEGEIVVESPNEKFQSVLEKLDEIKIRGDTIEYRGRVKFLRGPM